MGNILATYREAVSFLSQKILSIFTPMMPRLLFILLFICSVLACQSDAPKPNDGVAAPPVKQQPKRNANTETDSAFSDLVSDYEDHRRKNWQKPQEVINSLGDLTDAVVADIGAGTGYFSLRMLPYAKKVIAIDIDERMTNFITNLKQDLEPEFGDKLDVRLASESNPNLKEGEADIIFLSNTYAYIDDRIGYFKRLKGSFTPNGKLFIVDFKKKRIPVHPDPNDRIALYQVENELIAAGYEVLLSDDLTLPYQYILEARPALD